jgi:hypothetical protein
MLITYEEHRDNLMPFGAGWGVKVYYSPTTSEDRRRFPPADGDILGARQVIVWHQGRYSRAVRTQYTQ